MRRTVLTAAIAALALTAPAMADQHKSGKMNDDREPGGQMFDRLDANNDGKVDRMEIKEARDARFARLDADGDGRVTPAEFESGRKAMMEERRADRQDRMFARQDANGDGVLTSDEVPGQGMERMLDRLDSDGDGAVSREEMSKHRDKMRAHGKKGRHMRHHGDDGKKDDDGGH